jgi:hypothetical protein
VNDVIEHETNAQAMWYVASRRAEIGSETVLPAH